MSRTDDDTVNRILRELSDTYSASTRNKATDELRKLIRDTEQGRTNALLEVTILEKQRGILLQRAIDAETQAATVVLGNQADLNELFRLRGQVSELMAAQADMLAELQKRPLLEFTPAKSRTERKTP